MNAMTHMPAPTGPTQDHPDAELMWLCAEIDRLEDEWLSLYAKPGATQEEAIAAEDRADAARDGFFARQAPLIERIGAMTATTLEGLKARARTIVKWAPDALGKPKMDAGELMIAALLRDLVAESRT